MRTHSPEVRRKAMALLHSGARNADVARELNVPVGTVGHWLHNDRARRGACPGRPVTKCPRCDGEPLAQSSYAYLLGLYLGDGHIGQYRKHRVPSLRITCADSWPGLMDECEFALRAVLPGNAVSRVRKTGCHDVKVVSRHLWCLFPQHGPGKKHDRPIVLEPWQQDIVEAHPWEFIRGLIHSDGSRITNWTEKLIGGERKRYEYVRYFFTNTSTDILGLFTDALNRVGVEWRSANQSRRAQNISVARKASVQLMDQHIGPKY
ncbi:helix-turn-helix domain-containing protein [Streptomyces sp. NPDC001691]|uniref:helix-turn-helix domain-containing protein n=1 Tax=Streptomyces sp. NPDC001691 TaxID=3364600 RepID=UPI0036BB31EE